MSDSIGFSGGFSGGHSKGGGEGEVNAGGLVANIVIDFNTNTTFPQTNSEINVISDLSGGQVTTVDGQNSYTYVMNTSQETGFGNGNPLSSIGDESATANNKILATTYLFTRRSLYFRIFGLPPLLTGTVRMTTWRNHSGERLVLLGVGIQAQDGIVLDMYTDVPTTIELPFETSESGVAWFQASTWNSNNSIAYISGIELIFDGL